MVEPRLGVRVERRTTAAGEVELVAVPVHRIRVHAGRPTRGSCGQHALHYTRGDLDLLPIGYADVWHERDACSSLLLEVTPPLLRRAAEAMGRDPDRSGLALRHQFRDAQIEHIAWALDAHQRAGRPNGVLYEESLGLGLAVHLLGGFAAPDRTPRGLSKPQLRRVTDVIEAELSGDLSLERLAQEVAVSASHFKVLFKRTTGVPVHEFVMQRRVERARSLLQRGTLPASQVALEAGFSHQSHMARCMRRMLGVTPGAIARSASAAR